MNIKNLPKDFNYNIYRTLNNDLNNLNDIQLGNHYIEHGYNEGRLYKISLPNDFNYNNYKFLNNDLSELNDNQLKYHYINHGFYENRLYKKILPEDFYSNNYKILNSDLGIMSDEEYKNHYINIGFYQNRFYQINLINNYNNLKVHYLEEDNSYNYDSKDNSNYLKKMFNNINVYINLNNCNLKEFNIDYKLFLDNLNFDTLIDNNLDHLIISYPYIGTKYLKYHKDNICELLKSSDYDIIELSLIIDENNFYYLIENELTILPRYNYCINNLDCYYITKSGYLKIKQNMEQENNIFHNLNIGFLTRPLFNYNYYNFDYFDKDKDNNNDIIDNRITKSNILIDTYYRVTSNLNRIYCINLGIDINKKNNMIKYKNMLNYTNDNFFYNGILGINLPDLKDLANIGIYKSNLLSCNLINKKFPEKGAIGLNITQNNLFKEAVEKNYKYALILEDDISFNGDYFKVLDIIFQKYKDLDILYLGCSSHVEMLKYFDLEQNINNYIIFKPKKNISEKISLGGFFAVLLSQKALKILNERFTPIDNISDILLCDLIFDIKNDYEDETIFKTRYNLNSLLIQDLFKVDVNKISLT